jgi:pheromone shutdown-related protein TraB
MSLNVGGKQITLIGTAHISKESINEVREAIQKEKPDVVCVELDQGRYDAMASNVWAKLDVAKVFKEGKGFLLMANLVLAGFQRRMGNELGVKPGEEMRAALDTAKEMGIAHALCDREVQITLRRAWARCGFWGRSKLIAALVSSAFTTEKLSEKEIENLKNRNELDGMMSELSDFLPAVKETLIDERDRYLAAKIWASGGQRPLAVVGAGHMGGIKAHLEKIAANSAGSAGGDGGSSTASGGNAKVDVSDLDQIPPKGIVSKLIPWIIPAIVIALLGYGVYKMGVPQSIPIFARWVLWNGGLAAIGAIIALGHPLSILVSLLGAPITSAIPIVGVGLFSGLTQATVCKPRVIDAEDINNDMGSLKGMYRNRIIRAFLVFFLSSVGSSIGTFLAISSIAGTIIK